MVTADHHGLLCLHQSDLAGDGQGGARVVAGHHDDADAGRGAARNGLRHLGPRRVFQPDQPGEGHATLLGRRAACDRTMGESQHAQAGLGHRVLRRQQARLRRGIERRYSRVELHQVTGREHRLRRALAVEHAALRRRTQHRHALAVGVEGDLVDARKTVESAGHLPAHAGQRYFHRIAQQFALAVVVHLIQVVAERGIDE
jgi:hypothetical protein